ncbi:MAG: BACON domain-containing carbohydrate-binding protein [Acidobacteria bacterium]|nr:BACON domain-containing carbohydrate-binding protein [Acidobacteriota bacterium]
MLSMLLFLGAIGALAQTPKGYWKQVGVKTFDVPQTPSNNVQETISRQYEKALIHQYTNIYGPIQGADIEIVYATPPSILIPGTPFPAMIKGITGWYAFDKGNYGFGKFVGAYFDNIANQEDVWARASEDIPIGGIIVGVNFSGAQLSATFNNATSANPVLVPAVRWAAGSRSTFRYLATKEAQWGWGWVYEWTLGEIGSCAGSCTLGSTALTAGPTGGNLSIPVTATSRWDVAAVDPWITVTSPASSSGNGTVTISVTPNPGDTRTGTLRVAGQSVTIVQIGGVESKLFDIGNIAGCSTINHSEFTLAGNSFVNRVDVWYKFNLNEFSVPYTLLQGTQTLKTGTLVKNSCDTYQPNWCIARATLGAVMPAGEYRINVPNSQICQNAGSQGKGFVSVFGSLINTGAAGGACSGNCSLNSPGQSIDKAGGTGNINVTATGTWTTISFTPWIKVTSGSSGSGNGTVGFTVDPNTGPPRSGAISVAGQAHSVHQSSCAWTSSTDAGWITLRSGTSSTGNGGVAFAASSNDTGLPRSAAIIIAGQIIVVNQAGGVPPGTPAVSAGGTVNTASYAPGGPPNGSLAQGSFFSIYGGDLGPDQFAKAAAYPLPTSLGGVSIVIATANERSDAYLVFASKGQINAVVPSNIPLGDAQVIVSYNGKTSAPAPIRVVRSSVGVFFQRVNGKDLAIAQNVVSPTDYPLNLPDTPAKPGQIVILWATGMGPINTADNVAPGGGDMTGVPLSITVGGVPAQRVYAGRQPETAAVDNIYFTVPANAPLGCQVPVEVTAGGLQANTTYIAISATGSRCQ